MVCGLAYGSAYSAIMMFPRIVFLRFVPHIVRAFTQTLVYCPICQAFWYGALVGRLFDPLHFISDGPSAWWATGAYACAAMATACAFFRNYAHPTYDSEMEMLIIFSGGTPVSPSAPKEDVREALHREWLRSQEIVDDFVHSAKVMPLYNTTLPGKDSNDSTQEAP